MFRNALQGKRLCIALFVWCGLAGAVRADLITTLTLKTDIEGSLTRYTYELTNDARSDIAVAALSLAVDVKVDLQGFVGPTGWGLRHPTGTSFLDLESASAASDLKPGASDTFTFLSSFSPGLSNYSILGLDESPPFRVLTNKGQIGAPISGTGPPPAVPEPASLTLLSTGAVALLGYGWRRRRQAESARGRA